MLVPGLRGSGRTVGAPDLGQGDAGFERPFERGKQQQPQDADIPIEQDCRVAHLVVCDLIITNKLCAWQ